MSLKQLVNSRKMAFRQKIVFYLTIYMYQCRKVHNLQEAKVGVLKTPFLLIHRLVRKLWLPSDLLFLYSSINQRKDITKPVTLWVYVNEFVQSTQSYCLRFLQDQAGLIYNSLKTEFQFLCSEP